MKNIIISTLSLLPFICQAQNIITIAGNGSAGFSGNGGPAIAATMEAPYRARHDASGNIYIADFGNNHIRKINTAGIINNVAGNGLGTHDGDGGPATSAGIITTTSVAIDIPGNIYIAEDSNVNANTGAWVRKVNTLGTISTIAGNGIFGFKGDGGKADTAEFNDIEDIVLDKSGNIYIADTRNFRIRKIDTFGFINTVAGNGIAGSSGDGGLAINAQLTSPRGIAVDNNGNIFIADGFANRIRKVDTFGMISTIAGNGMSGYLGDGLAATSAELNNPYGVAVDDTGNIYIADWQNYVIRKVDQTGIISTIAGNGTSGYTGDNGPAVDAQLSSPVGVDIDDTGNIFVGDVGASVVRKILPNNIEKVYNRIISNSFKLFPDPAYANISILSPDNAFITSINIVNELGQTVFYETCNDTQINIDVSEFSNGIYFIELNHSYIKNFTKINF